MVQQGLLGLVGCEALVFGDWGCEMGRVYIYLNSVGGDLSILDACGDMEVPERLRKCRSTPRGRILS